MSSTALSWALFEFALHPVMQTRLRAEMRSISLPVSTSTDTPLDGDTIAALERLPLLDSVLRETLRLHAPIPANHRMATRDTTIPLSAPVTDRHGVARSVLQLKKGDQIYTPNFLVNRLKDVYGADADEWMCVLAICWS
jgi:cytochrome P450